MRRLSLPLSLCCVLGACADGGDEDRPQSEVRFSAQHHLFGFRALRGFATFPVPATVCDSDRGRLNLFDDSTYTVARSSGTSAADRYALEASGEFSVYVTGGSREPSVVFLGAYSREDATNLTSPSAQPDFFFTDRVSTPSSERIGLYYGTRVINGQVELGGDWHLFSLHLVFDQSLQTPENVARAVRGGIDVAFDGLVPGTLRALSGSGQQSTGGSGTSSITFGGSIQNVLDGNGSGDGTCNLTLTYNGDDRVMRAVANDRLVLALDDEETDGEAGIALLVRKFDAPAQQANTVEAQGTFLVGGQTYFVNPSNSGSDAFVGTVTLASGGAFRLDAVGNQGQDFSYIGTWSLATDGGVTITVNGTGETWFGAIDTSYNTFVFVDPFVEVRANNLPELNLGFGVRRKS